MDQLKISLITVTYNADRYIARCIDSVIGQAYDNLEYIIIDGGSSDQTVEIVHGYQKYVAHFVSERDNGIYDAMNKGISLASGDIVGILNADDYFADENVLSAVAETFQSPDIYIVYGNLEFVNAEGRSVRKWQSGEYLTLKLNWGWMPPHPTFYCRRQLFVAHGGYSHRYGSAADYELMLRFLRLGYSVRYLNKVMVKMETGGVSNRSLKNRLKAMRYDLKAMRNNNISIPILAILLKPLRKIGQFFTE
jgi:glycosyltransferase involved in cell wall biosynthesis